MHRLWCQFDFGWSLVTVEMRSYFIPLFFHFHHFRVMTSIVFNSVPIEDIGIQWGSNPAYTRVAALVREIRRYGVVDVFEPADLLEKRNIPKVTKCLAQLSKLVSNKYLFFWVHLQEKMTFFSLDTFLSYVPLKTLERIFRIKNLCGVECFTFSHTSRENKNLELSANL